MKIEKLDINTLKIVLTVEELSLKNITIKDIESGKKKAQNFFFDIIQDSSFANDFLKDDTKLLVEASISNDQNLIVTITKINHTPLPLSKPRINVHNITCSAYIFNCLDNLLAFVHESHNENLFTGINDLYLYDNLYILIFSKTSIQHQDFKKTFAVLIEYCDKYFSKQNIITNIKENSKLLIAKNSLQSIYTYLFE